MNIILTGYQGGIGSAIYLRLGFGANITNNMEVFGHGDRYASVEAMKTAMGWVIAHGQIDCEDDPAAAWENNYFSAIRYAELFEAHAPKGARLIAITSNSAVIPRSPTPTYCATKAALDIALHSIHRRVAATERYIFTIQAGLIDTPVGMQRLAALGEEKYAEQMRRLPLKRIGHAEEIAEWVEFLLTAPGAILGSGQPIRLDGGEH